MSGLNRAVSGRRWSGFALATLLGVAQLSAQGAVGRSPTAFGVSDSGEANYNVPIFTPPGTRGMTPQLAFSYSHNAGMSSAWLGWGWQISGMSAISRCARTWAQDGVSVSVKLDATDRFCLDGQQLKFVSGTAYGADGAEYRTEIESFARIKSYGVAGTGPAYFVVERKDGSIAEYGNRADSRIEALGLSTARAWALTTLRDRDNNRIEFNYTEDTTNGSYNLASVQYATNPTQGITTAPYTVSFTYATQSTNEIQSEYFGGTLVKDVKRMTRVDVNYGATLVRRYNVAYEGTLSSASHSRVASITECVGATGTDCLPATGFAYQNGTSAYNASAATPNAALPFTRSIVMDVNGDGRSDLVYPSNATQGSGTWMIAFANSSGGYNTAINSGVSNAMYFYAAPIDYDADGLADLIVPLNNSTWWIVRGTPSGFATPFDTGVSAAGAVEVRGLDINGDGLDDVVWNNGLQLQYRLRVAGGTFSATIGTLLDSGTTLTIVGDAGGRNYGTAPDFNGDGHADIIVTTAAEWPLGGYIYATIAILSGTSDVMTIGSWSAPYGMLTGDFNADGYSDLVFPDPSGTQWAYCFSNGKDFNTQLAGPVYTSQVTDKAIATDYDGDGFTDILVPGTDGIWKVLRSTGEGFPAAASTGLAVGALDSAFLVDANGDGLADVLTIAATTGQVSLLTHQGVIPDLLLTATDGFSNTATFAYTALTQGSYTKGTGAAFPDQEWQGPMYVVSTLTASNGIGGSYTLTYNYYTARLHLQGRGFLGFGARRIQDSRTGNFAFDYFNQTFPYIGLVYQHDDLQPDAATRFGQLVSTWSTISAGTAPEARQFPYISTATAKRWEQGGTYNGNQINQSVTTTLIDSYGTPYDVTTVTTESATANGVQSGAQYTQRTYLPTANLVNDTTTWCLGRPNQTQQINSHTQYGGGAITRTVNRTWNTTYCRPTQEVIEPGNTTLQVTRDLLYDGFGNLNSETVTGKNPDTTTMAARTTLTNWGTTGRFPLTVTNALSQVVTTTYSTRIALGLPDSQSDPNGLSVAWTYDDFGRKTKETRPDSTYKTWSYANCSPNCVNTNNQLLVTETVFNTANGAVADTQTYLDKFDRLLVSRSKRLSGTYTRVDRQYDGRGNVYRESEPCAWSTAATTCTYWKTLTYDVLNRPTQVSRAVSASDPTLQYLTTAYEGLTTRVVDALGEQKSTVKNVAGQLARSTDDAGYYQSFDYDAFGSPVRVTDSLGNPLQAAAFNVRGMKTSMTDMDMGSWVYEYDSLGEMLRIRDAKTTAPAWTTQMTYDALGRMTTRQDVPEAKTATWTWGTSAAAKNIGKLASLSTSDSSYGESFTYDSAGRPATKSITSDATYQLDYTYNNEGSLATLTYPTSTNSYRLKLQYDYQNGQLLRVKDFNAPTTVFWAANAANVRGQVTQETFGNGLITNRAYDAVTGWVSTIQTGPSGTPTSVQNLAYLFDKSGNLTQRQDVRQSLTENFYYDNLYRLDYSTLKVGTGTPSTNLDLVYDALGNITSKSDIGTYTYHGTKRHAVASTTNGWAFTYDANGNMITRQVGTNTISWFSYNQPNVVTHGATSNSYRYTPNRDRYRLDYLNAGITETTMYVGGVLEKWTKTGATTEYRHYISAGGQPVAILTRQLSNPTVSVVRYFHLDHLGSIETVTNSDQTVYVRESFDAFGKRRDPATWSGGIPSGDATLVGNLSRRGYTFHESLGAASLNNMNGRIQDPLLGRFISADPYIQDGSETQMWNRYSYVLNNPLSFTDPSGYFSLGTFLKNLVRTIVVQFVRIGLNAIAPGLGDIAYNAYNLAQGMKSKNWLSVAMSVSGLRSSVSSFGQSGMVRQFQSVVPGSSRSCFVECANGSVLDSLGVPILRATPDEIGLPESMTRTQVAIGGALGAFLRQPLFSYPWTGCMSLVCTNPEAETRTVTYGDALLASSLFLLPEAVAARAGAGALKEGTTVFRVFGGEARGLGKSWTTVNPGEVASFRKGAGLFPGNTGQFVIEGRLTSTEGVLLRDALPGPNRVGGGLPELVIPNPGGQVCLICVSGANPPF